MYEQTIDSMGTKNPEFYKYTGELQKCKFSRVMGTFTSKFIPYHDFEKDISMYSDYDHQESELFRQVKSGLFYKMQVVAKGEKDWS